MSDFGDQRSMQSLGHNALEDSTGSISFAFSANLPIVVEPGSAQAEAIRSVRGVLMRQHLEYGRRSLAICAPSTRNGCSFLAANIAVAMAQVGVNTLLIDGNLRKPNIQDYIVPSAAVAGLGDCIGDDTVPLSRAIQAVHPSLSVLYAGRADTFNPDWIGGNPMKTLVRQCLRDYDLTIFDSPPANRFADARRIASFARYALVVACRGRAYFKDVCTLIGELESDRTTVVGTYLNDY